MVAIKSSKKPRALVRFINIVLILVFAAIIFVYGESFSRNVLEGASVLQQHTVASPVEKPTEPLDDKHITAAVVQNEKSPQVTPVTPPPQEKEEQIMEESVPTESATKDDHDAEYEESKNSEKEEGEEYEEPKTADDDEEYEEYDEAKEAEDKDQNDSESDGSEFLRVLEKCRDLICIQEAHAKFRRSSDMFNFPHFMIIGFQKAATTSLKQYLEKHSHIIKPMVKEPNFFPYDCKEKPPEKCSEANTTRYITKTLHLQRYIDAKGQVATFEASTHIVRAGHNLAHRMAKLMPWLRIIIQLREPISRAASMLIHNKDVNSLGCLMRQDMGHCLLHHSQITEKSTTSYQPITYTEALQPWIEAFPRDQIHVVQYESLTSEKNSESELKRVKNFLGVDANEPTQGLGLQNARRFRINPEGWAMKRSEYEELLDIVRPDTDSLLELLYDSDLIDDTTDWKEIWEEIWTSNLDTCKNEKNRCNIMLS